MLKRLFGLSFSIVSGLLASAALLALAQRSAGVAWAAPIPKPLADVLTVGGPCGLSIQACIDLAQAGDEVHIPAGFYTESVTVAKSISVTGDLSSTTIIHALDNQRVMTITGGAAVFLADLTLTGGVYTSTGGFDPTTCGGGLRIYAAAPAVLQDIAIVSNTADCGGGLGVYGGAATLANVEIMSNTAGVGGGVVAAHALLNLSSGSIRHNVGTYLSGGLEQEFGDVTMSGGEVLSNSTPYFAGGVDVYGLGAVFTQTGGTIASNSAANAGGGLNIDAGKASLLGGYIMSNSAPSGGGVALFAETGAPAVLILNGGQIASNTASARAGGVYLGNAMTYFTQTAGSIAHNIAVEAGGLEVFGGQAWLQGGTIVDNRASDGGGVYVHGVGAAFTQTGGLVISNVAQRYGGGLIQQGNQVWLLGGSVVSNSAQFGGGIAAIAGHNGPSSDAQTTLAGGEVASNTASNEGGGVFLYGATGLFTDTAGALHNNTAIIGGGLYEEAGSTAWLLGGEIVSNSAQGAGAGVYALSSTVTLDGSDIGYNRSADVGGGLEALNSTLVMNSGAVTHNTAGYSAGGLALGEGESILAGGQVFSNYAPNGGGMAESIGPVILSGTDVLSNSADIGGGILLGDAGSVLTQTAGSVSGNVALTSGGGIASRNSRVVLMGGQVQSNTAANGGGLAISAGYSAGELILGGGQVASNTASANGGGIYLTDPQSFLTQTAGIIEHNVAMTGGGIYLDQSAAWITSGDIIQNDAVSTGGGIAIERGSLVITGSRLINNSSGSSAGALAQMGSVDSVSVTVANSCIAGNGPLTSVANSSGSTIDARGNWWGAADGPSGVGPGSGDSVSSGVDYTGFLATPPVAGCPGRTANLSVARNGSGAGTVTSSPAGIDCGLVCAETLYQGTAVTLTATPAVSSTLAGWSGACGGAGACVVTMTQSTPVTATFSLNAYSLTVGRAGNGLGRVTSLPGSISCGAACGDSFSYGAVVSLTAQPAISSTFTGWSGACGGAGPCAVTLTQPSAVTATFSLNSYTVTVVMSGTGSGVVTSLPAGVNCGQACAASFTYGTALTLTAVPTAGSSFAGWGGACTGAGLCGLVVTQAVTLTATFNVPPRFKTYLPVVSKGTAPVSKGSARAAPSLSEANLPRHN